MKGVSPTVMAFVAAVPLPQELLAVTERVPEVAFEAKLTVAALVVPPLMVQLLPPTP